MISEQPFISHLWSECAYAVPALDITFLHIKPVDQMQFTQKKVRFRKKDEEKEIFHIESVNKGFRIDDSPNTGAALSRFDNSTLEFSHACALAKAKLILLTADRLEYRRTLFQSQFPADTVLYWQGDKCYILDLMPPVAANMFTIPMDEIPSVSRKKAIHKCLNNPFTIFHFGEMPEWTTHMLQNDIPLTIVPERAALECKIKGVCSIDMEEVLDDEDQPPHADAMLTVVDSYHIPPKQMSVITCWVAIPKMIIPANVQDLSLIHISEPTRPY